MESSPCAAALGCVGWGCDCLYGLGASKHTPWFGRMVCVALNRQAVQQGCTVLALANALCQEGCGTGGGVASSAPFSWHGWEGVSTFGEGWCPVSGFRNLCGCVYVLAAGLCLQELCGGSRVSICVCDGRMRICRRWPGAKSTPG